MLDHASEQIIRRLIPHILGHPRRYWATALAVAAVACVLVLHSAQRFAEDERITALEGEVNRHAAEVMSKTLSGNFMGSLSFFGTSSVTAKLVASGKLPADSPALLRILRLLAEDCGAENCFLVDKKGIILADWDSTGKLNVGLDVGFRPYFKNAMAGRPNIYAAINFGTSERVLIFAAPLYAEADRNSPIIGVVALRVSLKQIDALLRGFKGVPLLLTPNGVVFASTKPEWLFNLAGEASQGRLQALRESRQFGDNFEAARFKPLPFALDRKLVRVLGDSYAVVKAPVLWNDPQGDWTLVLLDDLDNLLSPTKRASLILSTGASTLLAFFFVYMLLSNYQARRQAMEAELFAAERLRESEANLRHILAATPVPIILSRLSDEVIILANESAGEYFGLPWADLAGRVASSFHKDAKEGRRILAELRNGTRIRDVEVAFVRADGSSFLGLMSTGIITVGGEDVALSALVDITDRKRLESTLLELATKDGLTGLNNRRHFLELSGPLFEAAKRYGSPLAVAMLDIDHFKSVNDTWGHEAGDVVLKTFSQLALASFRSADIIGRLGGEEFAVVMPGTDYDGAMNTLERFRHAVETNAITYGETPLSITVSCGVALLSPADATLEILTKKADSALYKAKQYGRNRVIAFSEP